MVYQRAILLFGKNLGDDIGATDPQAAVSIGQSHVRELPHTLHRSQYLRYKSTCRTTRASPHELHVIPGHNTPMAQSLIPRSVPMEKAALVCSHCSHTSFIQPSHLISSIWSCSPALTSLRYNYWHKSDTHGAQQVAR